MSLQVHLFGTTFQNPILLAAGTCGFGREVADVIDLETLGGLVTKSVTLEPRAGNPPPRVTELPGGMLNSVGLANPGVAAVKGEYLPWLKANLVEARVLVSVAGHAAAEYPRLVTELDGFEGFLGYELNLSCPNDMDRRGAPFALDPRAVSEVVGLCRAVTSRPFSVKLAPNDPKLPTTVRAATEAGADALTLVNTLPGLDLDPSSARPVLGAGAGGVSGPALRASGVHAVAEARGATDLPLIGVGGVLTTDDAVQYLMAGASLVQVGTASFARPRTAETIIRGLPAALRSLGVSTPAAWAGPSAVRPDVPTPSLDSATDLGGAAVDSSDALSLGGGAA
jgi:dihydroorotate dehydrogenase (NAD+) catalytic subunit